MTSALPVQTAPVPFDPTGGKGPLGLARWGCWAIGCGPWAFIFGTAS